MEGTAYPSKAEMHVRNTWVYAQRIPGIDKSVLLALVHCDGETGKGIFPSLATVASMTGHARSTVQDAIKRLEAAGWLTHIQRDVNGRKTSNLYIVKQANQCTGSR